jgi:hypothetical protein
MIEEFELLYEQVPMTQSQQHNRDSIINEIKQIQSGLANIQAEYDEYKEAQHALR